jgi:hypothetical protein
MDLKYIAYFLLIMIPFFSCRSTDRKKEDMDSEVKQTGTDLQVVKQEAEDGYFEEFQLFKQQAGARLNKLETRIEEIKKSAPSDAGEASASYRKNISDAQHENTVLRKKLEEFNEEGKEKLWKFEKDFSKELNDLEQMVDKASNSLVKKK